MFKPNTTFVVNNNVETLPFADLAEACQGVEAEDRDGIVLEFGSKFGLKTKSWVYPQLLAKVGAWTLNRGTSGLYSSRALLRDNCLHNPTNRGYYYFLASNHRFVEKQYAASGREYCSLVPLILAAHKKMSDVKYSEWENPEVLVNSKLLESMETDYLDYTLDELLEFRVQGLTVKSGDKTGVVKSPVTTYGLNGLPKTIHRGTVELEGPGSLPALVRMMLCQTWCAHPNNRSSYMILDPKDWDRVPPALIETDPVNAVTQPAPAARVIKLPWD